jgi:hypothetical protein
VVSGDAVGLPYSNVARVMQQAFDEATADGGLSTHEVLLKIVEVAHVSETAVRSWLSGFRPPSKSNQRAIAKALFKTNTRRERLIKELDEAKKASKENLVGSWQRRLEQGSIRLKVRPTTYPGTGRFLSEVFLPFLDFGRIEHGGEASPRLDFRALKEETWLGKVDLALGILATPEIDQKLWCFESPPRYRLNFVVTKEGLEAARTTQMELQKLLAFPSPYTSRRQPVLLEKLRFIAMKGEIGRRYAKYVLRAEIFDLLEDLNPKEFAERLSRSEKDLCLCVAADEITCLGVLAELRHIKIDGLLVFPLSSPTTNPGLPGVELPYFPLALCVSNSDSIPNRLNHHLIEYLERSLPRFISGSSIWIAHSLIALREDLDTLAKSALPHAEHKSVRSWLDYCLRMDPNAPSDLKPHWTPVLHQARNIWAKRSAG